MLKHEYHVNRMVSPPLWSWFFFVFVFVFFKTRSALKALRPLGVAPETLRCTLIRSFTAGRGGKFTGNIKHKTT